MCTINTNKKLIFIHIPKTAGTSIERVLGGGGHLGILPIKEYFDRNAFQGEKFEDYFKFTFIRNPWDRLVSYFFYFGGKEKNFKRYVMEELDLKDITRMPQYKFICDNKKNIMVDYIGRFENLSNDWKVICDKINIPIKELPIARKSEHKNYRFYYDKETKDRISKLYKEDIKLFNYEF